MRILKHIILAVLMLCPWLTEAQNVPAPQIGLSGNIGCIGFPCLNSGTFQMPADANVTFAISNVNTSAIYIKVTSAVSLTATRTITYPAGRFMLNVENATSGGHALNVCGPTGACASVPNSTTSFTPIWNDGTNNVSVAASGGSCTDCVLTDPTADQTITGDHLLQFTNASANTLVTIDPAAGNVSSSSLTLTHDANISGSVFVGADNEIDASGSALFGGTGGVLISHGGDTSIGSGAISFTALTGKVTAQTLSDGTCSINGGVLTGCTGGGGGSGLSGMTAGQVPIAATATTVTSSKPIAGAGPALTSGPNSGVTAGDLALFTGTLGQITDGAIAGSAVVTLTGTQTLTNKTLTAPTITGAAIASSTIDGTVIGATTPSTGKFSAITDTALTTGNGVICPNGTAGMFSQTSCVAPSATTAGGLTAGGSGSYVFVSATTAAGATTSGALSIGFTTIPLVSATGVANGMNTFTVGASEYVQCTGLTGTTLTGCSGGMFGSTAATHATGSALIFSQFVIAASSGVQDFVVPGGSTFIGQNLAASFINVTGAPFQTSGTFFAGIFSAGFGLSLQGSQTLQTVQGSTGTKVFAATGSFTSGHLVSTDSSGNAVDAGKALTGSGTGATTGPTSSTAGHVVTFSDGSGTIADSSVALTSLATLAGNNTWTGTNTFARILASQYVFTGLSNAVTAGAGLGTSPTSPTVTGDDANFTYTVTTGATPSASSTIFTYPFFASFANAPGCSVTPTTAAAATALTSVYVTTSTTTFTLSSNATALPSATAMGWTVLCFGR